MSTAIATSAVRKWVGLVAASLGLFLGALDLMVNVALPALAADLGVERPAVQWIIVAYVGTMTGMQLVAGRLADLHGLKRCYLLGIVVYCCAVTAIGLASELATILGLRTIQAIGFALMATTAPALVTQLFAEDERGRALGAMTTVSTMGAIAATVGGGLLIDDYGWASTFLVRVPVGVFAFGLAWWVLRTPAEQDVVTIDVAPRVRRRTLDWWGAGFLFTAIAALVLVANLGGNVGWADARVLVLATLMVAAGVAFVRRERAIGRRFAGLGNAAETGVRTSAAPQMAPLLRLDVVSPEVLRALATAFLMSFSTFINLFLLPFFVIDVMAQTAAILGLLLMLPPVVAALSAPLAGWLSDRSAPRLVATGALVWLALSMASFASLEPSASVLEVGVRLACFGFGMGAFQASNMSSVMGCMPPDALGSGAAMLSLFFGLGMVGSVGLMTAVFEAFGGAAAFTAAFGRTYLVAAALLVMASAISFPGRRAA